MSTARPLDPRLTAHALPDPLRPSGGVPVGVGAAAPALRVGGATGPTDEHGHGHGHEHGHAHAHPHPTRDPHRTGARANVAAPPAGAPQPTSLLMQSAAVRVAMAAGLVALLWAAVAWSMAGAA